ncbi:hypothetical protein MC885_018425 [Smutsia gigantea]|nr:hypothetical protein MC885_018425 [Smutsia gigantea]
MAAPMEVAVCTDSAAQLWSCVVWELHSGANLLTYRGGQAGPRGLALLNGEYLLAAQLGKNYISAWELQRKDQLQQKIMCPGPVTCLTTSPTGLYVLAGIAESIYLWEVSTGNLLVILSRHYQDVSCLQFTGDSSYFLSGGQDCLVLAWGLSSVLQADPSRTPAPRHVWSHHTLPITDLHCGFGGPLARVATASLDQTVKLWEISSGELLLSVVFDVGIMAVTMDLAEHHMFCGGSDGSIFQVDLCTWVSDSGQRGGVPGPRWAQGHGCPGLRPPGSKSWCHASGLGLPHRMGSTGPSSQGPWGGATICPSAHGPFGLHSLGKERRLSSRSRTAGRCSKGTGAGQVSLWGPGAVSSPWVRSASGLLFLGAPATRNQVTCLSVSTDGSVLLSGSHDETVRMWDTQSKQCIRTLTLKGPVTNATIVLAPVGMLSSDFRPSLPLPRFNKHLLGAEHGDELQHGSLTLRLGLRQQGLEPSYLERAEQLQAVMSSAMEKNVLGGQEQLRIRVAELEDEVQNLRKINRDLFDFSTRVITRPAK